MKTLFNRIIPIALFLFLISCGGGGGDTGTSISSKDITAFSFTSPAATGKIDSSSKTIVVCVPSGTDVSALVATFTTSGKSVVVGSTTQVSGSTSNNFTNSVTYKVIAIDGSYQNYTVAVTVATTQWARTVAAGNNQSFFYSVATASDGSVYTAGSIIGTDTFNFGNGMTTAGTNSSNNILLVKYNSSGTAQWARTVTTGDNISSFNGVSVAVDGSVYAAGYITGTGSYGFGNSVTAAGTSSGINIILVKYDSTGVAQWARTVVAGTGSSRFLSVSVAADGSVYAAGYIYGTTTCDFGNGITAAGINGTYNIVLVKYDSAGLAQWARTVIAGSNVSYFNSVSASSDGSVYAAGSVVGTGSYNFGDSVTATGTYSNFNIILVKYSSTGTTQWAQTMTTGNSFSVFNAVAVTSDGSMIYAVGYIYGAGTYNFGNSVTAAGTYADGENVIVAKYSNAGAAQWARTVTTGSSNSQFYSVSVASDGSVFASGYIAGTGAYNFGSDKIAIGPNSFYNVILVKYDSSGATGWAQTVTAGSSNSRFDGVSVASDGSIYAAGWIYGTGAYGFGNSVTATGLYNGYNIALVKYN